MKRDDQTGRIVAEHGYFGTRVYRIWQGMKNRATNSGDKDASRYALRGIDMDPRWANFVEFLEDMGEPPSDCYSLDRIDNERGYWPQNCRWATSRDQSRNRRTNRFVTFCGETLCVADWAARVGVTHAAMRARLRKWPLEKALTVPPVPAPERRSFDAS